MNEEPRFRPHTAKWFIPPQLTIKRDRISRKLLRIDPMQADFTVAVKPTHKPGQFAPSRSWVPYSQIQSIAAGYLTPLYPLNAVRERYGLTVNGMKYFKRYILPDPITVVRRRSVPSHHWSRFTLMALDVVLRDLEKRGLHYILKDFADHIAMIDTGTEFLAEYYAANEDAAELNKADKFGVIWLTDIGN